MYKAKTQKLILFLCFFSSLILICPLTTKAMVCTFFAGIIALILYNLYKNKIRLQEVKPDKADLIGLLVIVAAVVLALLSLFITRWMSSGIIDYISYLLHLPLHIFVIGTGIVFATGAFVFFYIVIQRFILSEEILSGAKEYLQLSLPKEDDGLSLSLSDRAVILFCAAVVISACSRSSPLYPFNNWDDANCFFTVGKSMFNGLVPYRDLIEQKGPLLYFLYGLAWHISNTSFLGVYFLEILAAYFYLLYSYRTSILLLKKKYLILVPVFALLSYSSFAFEQGGSAEEICLPLLVYSLYTMLKYCINRKAPSTQALIMIGFMSGCVFWIKFTLIGLYIGWFIWFAFDMIRCGHTKKIFSSVFLIAAGVLLATIPWLIYFGINHAIADWMRIYIYDNLFVYTQLPAGVTFIEKLPYIGKLLAGLQTFIQFNPFVFVICTISFALTFIHRKERHAQLIMFTVASAFFFLFVGGCRFRYYSFAMNAFLAAGMSLLFWLMPKRDRFFSSRRAVVLSAIVCLSASFFITPNRYFRAVDKSELAQYQFQEIISEKSENATLLNYNFLDGGFYTTCDIVPNCKAFCGLNIALSELRELQNYYVQNGLCDFVITRTALGIGDAKVYNPEIFERYECIAVCDSDYSWSTRTYRLYQLTDPDE